MSKRPLPNSSEKLLQRESPRDILQEDLLHHRKQQQKKTFPQNYRFNTGKDNYKTEKV